MVQIELDEAVNRGAQFIELRLDFFAKAVVPSVPLPEAKQFADSISILSDKNDKIKGFDISKFIDASYIQKAVALGLDKAP